MRKSFLKPILLLAAMIMLATTACAHPTPKADEGINGEVSDIKVSADLKDTEMAVTDMNDILTDTIAARRYRLL